jgi:hypothetical protein
MYKFDGALILKDNELIAIDEIIDTLNNQEERIKELERRLEIAEDDADLGFGD